MNRILGIFDPYPPHVNTNLLLQREQFFEIFNPSPPSVHVVCERPLMMMTNFVVYERILPSI